MQVPQVEVEVHARMSQCKYKKASSACANLNVLKVSFCPVPCLSIFSVSSSGHLSYIKVFYVLNTVMVVVIVYMFL